MRLASKTRNLRLPKLAARSKKVRNTDLVTKATIMQNSPFSPLVVAMAIASTQYIYSQKVGQAELAWVSGLNTKY